MEHLLRDVKDTTISTLANEVLQFKFSFFFGASFLLSTTEKTLRIESLLMLKHLHYNEVEGMYLPFFIYRLLENLPL